MPDADACLSYDLSIAFGITKSSSLASNTTFGTPLNYTVDLVALGFSDTGPGEFTIEVPVKADQLPEGENDCAYVIVAAVTRAVGSLVSGFCAYRRRVAREDGSLWRRLLARLAFLDAAQLLSSWSIIS